MPFDLTRADLKNIAKAGAEMGLIAAPGTDKIMAYIKAAQGIVGEVKGILEILLPLTGNKLSGLQNGVSKMQSIVSKAQSQAESRGDLPAEPGANVYKNIQTFLALCTMRYGDISLEELLQKLRGDYGSKKISDFLKGGRE